MTENRRPVTSRNKTWAKKLAYWCAQRNISPNFISILSIVFSIISLVAFYLDAKLYWNHYFLMIIAVLGIQGRLIMNLLDGMVAVEYNKKSVIGGLFNEVPDRISDSVIILGVGLLSKSHQFGMDFCYLAITLSIATAYIRTLGASLNCPHFFVGPMAKQHRMALITASCIISIWYSPIFYYMLIFMNIGLIITCYRRISKIVNYLNNQLT